jgi:hypothetical protein
VLAKAELEGNVTRGEAREKAAIDNRRRHVDAGLMAPLKDMHVAARDAQFSFGHARLLPAQEIYEHDNSDLQRAPLGKIAQLLLTGADGSTRCWQLSCQDWFWNELFTTSNCGAGEGTLTPGLILGKYARNSLDLRPNGDKLVRGARCGLAAMHAVAGRISWHEPAKASDRSSPVRCAGSLQAVTVRTLTLTTVVLSLRIPDSSDASFRSRMRKLATHSLSRHSLCWCALVVSIWLMAPVWRHVGCRSPPASAAVSRRLLF